MKLFLVIIKDINKHIALFNTIFWDAISVIPGKHEYCKHESALTILYYQFAIGLNMHSIFNGFLIDKKSILLLSN